MTERYTVHLDESGKFLRPTWWLEDSETAEVSAPFDSKESAQEEADKLNEEETALCYPMQRSKHQAQAMNQD